MNLGSFLDELLVLGHGNGLSKLSTPIGDIPSGMVDNSPAPEADDLWPHEAATRLPKTKHTLSAIKAGELGNVTNASNPIDRERFNRIFRYRT